MYTLGFKVPCSHIPGVSKRSRSGQCVCDKYSNSARFPHESLFDAPAVTA